MSSGDDAKNDIFAKNMVKHVYIIKICNVNIINLKKTSEFLTTFFFHSVKSGSVSFSEFTISTYGYSDQTNFLRIGKKMLSNV